MSLRTLTTAPDAPAYAVPALCVGLLAFAHGGYFPEAWGWGALGLCLCAVWAVMLRESVEVSLGLAWLGGGVAAVCAWAALSLVWTADTTGGVQSVQRDGLYLTLMLAAVAVVRRGSRLPVIAGITGAIVVVSAYAVCTRLLPDRLGTFTDPQGPGRLYTPVGYWNGAAELAAIGLGIVLCAFVYVTSLRLRIVLSATLPVLALAMFFTYSRGPIVALAGGVLVVLVLERRRVSVLAWVLAQSVVPAALVAVAASLHRLSGAGYGRASAGQGHRLAVLLAVACVVSALVGWGTSRLETRVRGEPRVRTWFLRAIPVAAASAVVVAVVVSPGDAVHRIERSFHSSGPAAHSSARLASVSPDSRLALWSVAWDTARRHPLIGAGAGSFETEWLAHRTQATDTRFAHSIFLEAAAEGGLPGLALTAAVLLGPLAAAVRLRRRAGVCLAAGAYAIFVIHASFDWDWELPAVTAAGLWCAVALLADAGPPAAIPARTLRAVVVTAAVVAVGLAAAGLAGNRDLAQSRQAGQAGDYPAALRAARAAARWQPWSYLPDQDQGAWYAAGGDLPRAAAAYRRAVRTAPSAWSAWFGLAQVTTGREQANALHRARRLNPESRQIAAFCTDSLAGGCES